MNAPAESNYFQAFLELFGPNDFDFGRFLGPFAGSGQRSRDCCCWRLCYCFFCFWFFFC